MIIAVHFAEFSIVANGSVGNLTSLFMVKTIILLMLPGFFLISHVRIPAQNLQSAKIRKFFSCYFFIYFAALYLPNMLCFLCFFF